MPEICQAGFKLCLRSVFCRAKTDNKQFPIFIQLWGTESENNFEQILNFVNFKV